MYTVHEVSNLTGISIRKLRYYDEKGVLSPCRNSSGKNNNQKEYSLKDIEKLGLITHLQRLGMSIKEIKAAFADADYSQAHMLRTAIERTRDEIAYLENVVFLSQFACLIGTDIFSVGAFKRDEINSLANGIKTSSVYKAQMARFENLTEEEFENLNRDAEQTIMVLARLDGPRCSVFNDEFSSLCAQFLAQTCMNCEGNQDLPHWAFFTMGLALLGNGEFSSQIDSMGYPGLSRNIGVSLLFQWARKVSMRIFPQIICIANKPNLNPKGISVLLDTMEEEMPTLDMVNLGPEGEMSRCENILGLLKMFAMDDDLSDKLGATESSKPTEEDFARTLDSISEYLNLNSKG